MSKKIEFDPTQDHQKHRDANGLVSFTQNGRKYTAGGRETGVVPASEDPDHRQSIRERADQRLEQFREPEATGPVEKALKENRAAAAAAENAE